MSISPIKDLEPIKIIDSLVNSEIRKEICEFEIKLEKQEIDSFLKKFEDEEEKIDKNERKLTSSDPSKLGANDIDIKPERKEKLENNEKNEIRDKSEKAEQGTKSHLPQHRGLKKTEKMMNINKPTFFDEEKGKIEGKKAQRLFSINILEKVEELSNSKN